MRNKETLRKINWFIFAIVIILGLMMLSEAFQELRDLADSPGGADAQSRRDFRWDSSSTVLLVVLLSFTSLLLLLWKRIFPFNVPVALILLGFYYLLFFMTFTTGWVGLVGVMGLAAAVLIGVIMIIAYTIYLW
ncbi:RND transporter [Bacillus salacetis]|uniref:RND transporter n=1 Tax=Bacillus salacetis TaxID=2315464 RepID=A0A3A1QVI6_9BACI|nr:RND transporter [Bacillus salacetis]RIW31992.1 RND transporter [Bacillus salacetis]